MHDDLADHSAVGHALQSALELGQRDLAESLHKMAIGEALPVIDREIPLAEFQSGLKRMADRAVIGKIIVHIP